MLILGNNAIIGIYSAPSKYSGYYTYLSAISEPTIHVGILLWVHYNLRYSRIKRIKNIVDSLYILNYTRMLRHADDTYGHRNNKQATG